MIFAAVIYATAFIVACCAISKKQPPVRAILLIASMLSVNGASLIERIALVESRNETSAIGDNGKALGAYQLTEAAWADVNSLRQAQMLPEFEWQWCAMDGGTAREYCCQYLGILSRQLQSALRRSPTDAELYCAYNLGFSGFKQRGFDLKRCPKSTRANVRKVSR